MVSYKTLAKGRKYKYNNHTLKYWGTDYDCGKRRPVVFVFFDERGNCHELKREELNSIVEV